MQRSGKLARLSDTGRRLLEDAEIPMVWVVRPENVAGLDLPPHVRVFCNTRTRGNELSGSLTRDGAAAEGGRGAMRSRHTGFGDVFGQGYSCNRLSVESRCVAEGVTGMLCRPADPEHMVSCMRLLWRDRELNERMGENGLRFAETFCTESHARDEMREYLARCGLSS